MEFRFSILGHTRLRIGDRFDDQWGQPKLRGILAVLLLHPRQAVPIDTIADWVWPAGEGPGDPVGTFQRYAGRIRDALNQMDPAPLLHSQNGAYRLAVDRDEIDYFQYRAAVERGRQASHANDHERAYRILDRALECWTDRPFADLHGDRAVNRRLRADTDLWLPAYDALLGELSTLGRYDEVLHRLDDLPVDHDTHLSLASHRLTALYALNRRKEAISYVHHARKQLRANDELDEADELLCLHDELRRNNDPRPSATRNNSAASTSGRLSPHMLPHDVPDFVGRADLLNALDTRTTTPEGEPTGTVVIIDGPPGVGKTALVTRWIHRTQLHFPGGILFTALDGYSDRAKREHTTIIDDFLIALGHPPDHTMSAGAKEHLLSRLIAELRTLVVLDNAYDTAHVRDLVSLLAGSLVLITSRQRLRTLAALVGARRVTVEPMTATESTELLATQLDRQRPIHDADRARLVQRCGGLPLAITVLTAHVATSPTAPLAEFANRLTPRQLIVDLGEHGEGEVNVGSLFDQSYRALTEPQQRLFRLLGLHPGPDISEDAARACDADSQDTPRSLAALVSAHLLEQPDTFDRYRLHDLLAEFAAHCAETDEPADRRRVIGRRILRYYLESTINAASTLYPSYLPPPPLDGEPDVQPTVFTDNTHARTWFHQERTNLTAAIEHAVDQEHHDIAWRLVDPVSTFFDRQGYNTDSRAVRELALVSARATADQQGQISTLIGLGMVDMRLGDHIRARQNLDTALRLATEDDFDRGQASALHQLGRLEMMRSDPAAALQLFLRGLSIADRMDDDEGRCWYHCRIGEALRATEQYDEAVITLHEARRIAQRIGEESAHAGILIELGSAYRDRGDYSAADAHLERARTLAESIPDLAATAQAHIELAELHHARHHTDLALRHAQRAVDLCQQTHNRVDSAHALTTLGDIRQASGDPHDAVLAWRQAADLYHLTGNAARAGLLQSKIHSASPSQGVIVPTSRTGSQPASDPVRGSTTH